MSEEPIATNVTVTEDEGGVLITAGGWCAPSAYTWDMYNTPVWASELSALAYKFEKRAKKLEKKERKLMPVYRSTAKIETLRKNARELHDLVDKLAKEWPVGSVNEGPKGTLLDIPEIVTPRGPIIFDFTKEVTGDE